MKTPLYVIVHPDVVEGLAGTSKYHREVLTEIKTIQEEEKENCILFKGEPQEITEQLPIKDKTREIRVCGAFSGNQLYAVDLTCKILRKFGYNAVVYGPGTMLFPPPKI